jgi:diguanylate cyclase (GGDEF)-like protein
MFSLKLKLVAYFLVLSTLPLAAGYWGFASSLAGNELRRADERLSAELRAASFAYEEKLEAKRAEAAAFAASRALHDALLERDGETIRSLVAGRAGIEIRAGEEVYGHGGRGAPAATIAVRRGAVVLGEVVARLPVDGPLTSDLAARAALGDRDLLLVAVGNRIVSDPGRGQTLEPRAPRSRTITLLGRPYHAVVSPGAATLGVATPLGPIENATAGARKRLLLGVLASLLLIAVVAYAEGAAIVSSLRRFVAAAEAIARGRLDVRVPVKTRDEFSQLGRAFNEMADQLEAQRRRLNLATMRFGEALAATHDIDQLLRVIVTSAVESTRASGGVVRSRSGEDVARAGSPSERGERIELSLAVGGESFGTLVLTGASFDEHDREVARSLASHAVTALENARLHEIVKRQALVDSLTGMPNRRQCESALANELSRAKRFGNPLAFVLADLDGFKRVNDEHGHLAGDRVLREFGAILREHLRESDVAARWGGEEFALVLPQTDEHGASVLVERLRTVLEHRAIRVEGRTIAVTASFGAAIFPEEQTAERLIAAADEALYAAKRGGKNRLEVSRPAVRT